MIFQISVGKFAMHVLDLPSRQLIGHVLRKGIELLKHRLKRRVELARV